MGILDLPSLTSFRINYNLLDRYFADGKYVFEGFNRKTQTVEMICNDCFGMGFVQPFPLRRRILILQCSKLMKFLKCNLSENYAEL